MKETITQRVKGLLFANAEAEAVVRCKRKYGNVTSEAEQNLLKEQENNFRQKILVLREVLGTRVASKVEADGWWSGTERFAKEHGLNKYDLW